MLHLTVLAAALFVSLAPAPQEPRRAPAQARAGGSATLAVRVTDAADAPLHGVRIVLDGPAHREAATEQGRIAFENLPAGTYRLRFEREGYITLEREVVARGRAPIDVRVSLTPAPPPPPAPDPAPVPAAAQPPQGPSDRAPVAIDLPAFIEKNYIGREPRKISSLGCNEGTVATLIQLHEPLAEHAHDKSDEFLYVIAGQGTARVKGQDQALRAGVFSFVPRGAAHTVTASGRNPLVILSLQPTEGCAGPPSPAAPSR